MNMAHRAGMLGTVLIGASALCAHTEVRPVVLHGDLPEARWHSRRQVHSDAAHADRTPLIKATVSSQMSASSLPKPLPEGLWHQRHARSQDPEQDSSHKFAGSSWNLRNDSYTPTEFTQEPFVGNGYLGLRIPAIGQGYQGGNLEAVINFIPLFTFG